MIAAPEQHAAFLHAGGSHTANIWLAQQTERWEEKSFLLKDADDFLKKYSGLYDVYLSQNRFGKFRRVIYVSEISTMYSDIDYYNISKLNHLSAEAILQMVIKRCQKKGLPLPALAVDSGRGITLIWKHTPVSRNRLTEWSQCQKIIFSEFRDIGADRKSLDVTRVLRLCGTKNRKNDRLARCLYYNDHTISFDELAKQIIKVGEGQVVDQKEQAKSPAPMVAGTKIHTCGSLHQNALGDFTISTLWEARLTDLQTLLAIRHGTKLPPGQRDIWLFIASVALSWLCESSLLEREILALASQVSDWPEKEAKRNMGSVIRRAHQAATGQKTVINDLEFDPRYKLTNETIIQYLDLTIEEQRQLKTIIGKGVRRERDAARKRVLRQSQRREEYLIETLQRKEWALLLKGKGKTQREIATELGINQSTVSRYFQR